MKRPDVSKVPTARARAALTALMDWCEDNFPVSGIGSFVDTGSKGGRVVNVPGSGASGGIAIRPLMLLDASAGEELAIRVVYGTIAGEAPGGMNEGDVPEFILSGISGSGKVWGGVTRDADSGDILSRFIDNGASIPSNSETAGHFEIGSYSVTGGKLTVATAVSGSQAYQYCGGHLWGLV